MAWRSVDVIACQKDLKADVKLAMVRDVISMFEEKFSRLCHDRRWRERCGCHFVGVSGLSQWHWTEGECGGDNKQSRAVGVDRKRFAEGKIVKMKR